MNVKNNNHSEIYLMHNWIIGGHTRHIEVKQNFSHELKELGVVDFECISTFENKANMFMKN